MRVRNTGTRPSPPLVLHLGGDVFAPVHTGVPAIGPGQVLALRVPRTASVRGACATTEVVLEWADALGIVLQRGGAGARARPRPPGARGRPGAAGPPPRAPGRRTWRACGRSGAATRPRPCTGGPRRDAGGTGRSRARRRRARHPARRAPRPRAARPRRGVGGGLRDRSAPGGGPRPDRLGSGRRTAVLAADGTARQGVDALDALAVAQPSLLALDVARDAAGRDGEVLLAGARGCGRVTVAATGS